MKLRAINLIFKNQIINIQLKLALQHSHPMFHGCLFCIEIYDTTVVNEKETRPKLM